MLGDNVAGGMEVSTVAGTRAGMLGLWDPAAFSGIVDYDTWESEFLEEEDIVRNIRSGSFVPVNIGGDGSFALVVRSGSQEDPAVLNGREEQYLLASSRPYLFMSGSSACVSGIEKIESIPDETVEAFPLKAGEHSVTVHLIDWAAESGSRDREGNPTESALPDFVILINDTGNFNGPWRDDVETFERPRQR